MNVGFGLLDELIGEYGKNAISPADRSEKSGNALEINTKPTTKKPQILIAPSWQKDNILECCLDPLLEGLFALDARIIIRPHPEFVKRFRGKMRSIIDKYSDRIGDDFEIQTDFSSNSTVYNSDLVITDWSSIALEFSLTTKKPSLFINTPMKVMNPEWSKINIEPMDLWIRDRVGVSIDTNKLDSVKTVTSDLLKDNGGYKANIEELLNGYMYNVGRTNEAGGEYIIGQIQKRRDSRKNA